jgi:hypothetical protein
LSAALDSKVLAYAEGVDEPERQIEALAVIRSIPDGRLVVPAQALAELFNVLVRNARLERAIARSLVLTWQAACPVLENVTSRTCARTRSGDRSSLGHVGRRHTVGRVGSWLPAAGVGRPVRGLRLGITVVNPFAPMPHKLLDNLRSGAR